MCFYNSEMLETAKIAEKDILVYKGLDRNRDGSLMSPYFSRTKWEVGKIHRVKDFQRFGRPTTIDRGFHSCKIFETAKRHSDTVFLFRIPAGSIYWENPSEYVSDTIVLVKRSTVRKPVK